jgi:uncharacterized membrane protein
MPSIPKKPPVKSAPRRTASGTLVAPSKIAVPGNTGVKITRACTILKPAAELYAFWRNLENLILVIKHPATIERVSDIESRWSVSAPPGDRRVEWTSLIINDQPDRLLAWRSAEGAEIPNAGSVRFEPAPGDQGTEVTVTLEYDPPGGKLGALIAKLSGEEAGQQVADTLRRFKALMEAGEIPTTEGQPVGEPQKSKKESA